MTCYVSDGTLNLTVLLLIVGKTHTILGTAEMPGIVPRCMDDLFKAVHQQQLDNEMNSFAISYSYLEIYNEKVMVPYFNAFCIVFLVHC